MSISIRQKLFLQIIGIIIFFSVLIGFLNTNYLNLFYIQRLEERLVDYVNEINTYEVNNYVDILDRLIEMESKSNIRIMIRNHEDGLVYASHNPIINDKVIEVPWKKDINDKPPKGYKGFISYEKSIDGITMVRIFDVQPPKERIFVVTSVLNNGDSIELSTPLESINESIHIVNSFLFIITALTLVIASIITYFMSRHFTKPIMDMNVVTKKMKELNFSEECTIKTNDEIGQLAMSINDLSHSLDQSIQELNEKNKKLEEDIEREREIDEMRKQFISNVSHELKTPLTMLQGYAEGLKCNVVDNEEQKLFYCEVIEDEAKKMDKMVKELLNLTQLEYGGFKLNRITFDIVSLVNNLINKYNPILTEKDIKIDFNNNKTIMVNMDVLKCEQILTNYLNNAIQHVDERKKIAISLIVFDDYVRAIVYNSGEFIPEDEMENIWTSFYKLDKARSREMGGHGLGLSIVKAIQELNGREYGVRNGSRGVEFWFDIDLAENDEAFESTE